MKDAILIALFCVSILSAVGITVGLIEYSSPRHGVTNNAWIATLVDGQVIEVKDCVTNSNYVIVRDANTITYIPITQVKSVTFRRWP